MNYETIVNAFNGFAIPCHYAYDHFVPVHSIHPSGIAADVDDRRRRFGREVSDWIVGLSVGLFRLFLVVFKRSYSRGMAAERPLNFHAGLAAKSDAKAPSMAPSTPPKARFIRQVNITGIQKRYRPNRHYVSINLVS